MATLCVRVKVIEVVWQNTATSTSRRRRGHVRALATTESWRCLGWGSRAQWVVVNRWWMDDDGVWCCTHHQSFESPPWFILALLFISLLVCNIPEREREGHLSWPRTYINAFPSTVRPRSSEVMAIAILASAAYEDTVAVGAEGPAKRTMIGGALVLT